MNDFPRCLVLFALIYLGLAATARAQGEDYVALTDAELRQRFPVRYAGEVSRSHLPRLAIGAGEASSRIGATDAPDEGDFILSGTDRNGAAWTVNLGSRITAFGGRAFVADLDRNGMSDLILVAATGGNGLAPQTSMTALLFDAQGRPFPFTAPRRFEETEAGLPDLLDLNRDGRAEFVFMDYDAGYWVTQLYEADAGRMRLIRGPFAGRSFPLYTRFTNRPNRRAVAPRRGRQPQLADLSNHQPEESAQLASYDWNEEANYGGAHSFRLRLTDARAASMVCRSLPDFLVIDDARGRRISSFYVAEAVARALLDEIVAGRHEVSLFPNGNGCRPAILWAQLADSRGGSNARD